MSERNFRQLLEAQWDRGNFVCVGLDSEYAKLPQAAMVGNVFDSVVSFNRYIVNATRDLVCAYKPNVAFYEALPKGIGYAVLWEVIQYINKVAPEVPVILDAKRADIGNTNAGYVTSAFDMLGADAITVHPYLGREALQPFLDRKDKGIIVLCRTSNSGAGEFQDLPIEPSSRGSGPLYRVVARHVAEHWNVNGNCALVVGATYPQELAEVRSIVADIPILIPGIGAQGGDIEATVKAGKDSRGRGMIINSSRGIVFASSGEDFAEAARRETLKLHTAINQCLQGQKGVQNES